MSEELRYDAIEAPQYYIKVGTFEVGETAYENRCLSVNFGDQRGCIGADRIPWEGTEYKPWDFKYDGECFELDPIDIPVTPIPPTEIEQLRADVDYLLMMEG